MVTAFLYRHSFPIASPYRRNLDGMGAAFYIFLLCFLIAIIIALPFVYVPVTVISPAVIRSGWGQIIVSSPVDGLVTRVRIVENQLVSYNDTLLTLDTREGEIRSDFSRNQAIEARSFITDIRRLLKNTDSDQVPRLSNEKYRVMWKVYRTDIHAADEKLDQLRRLHERAAKLYSGRAITISEYEQSEYQYKLALAERERVAEQFRVNLQNDLQHYRSLSKEAEFSSAGSEYSMKNFMLTAPGEGYIQGIQRLHTGSRVYAGQALAEISPRGEFQVYCMVKPADTQLLKMGQKAVFKLDTYSLRVFSGRIVDIANDVTEENGTAYYRVTCSIDSVPGAVLRNGLLLKATIHVGNKSLFSLLYHRTYDRV